MDEVIDPSLHKFADELLCFTNEYPDLFLSDGDFVEFDSYLVFEADLDEGALPEDEVIKNRFNCFVDSIVDSIDYLSNFSLIRTCDAMEPCARDNLINKILIRLKDLTFLEEQYRSSFDEGIAKLHKDIYNRERNAIFEYRGLSSLITRINE